MELELATYKDLLKEMENRGIAYITATADDETEPDEEVLCISGNGLQLLLLIDCGLDLIKKDISALKSPAKKVKKILTEILHQIEEEEEEFNQ